MSVAMHIRDGLQTIAAAGTAVQLEDTPGATSPVVNVTVIASGTNEGTVVVGGPDVVAAAGTHAEPTRKGIPLAKGERVTLAVYDVTAVWVDSTTSGDSVSWTALAA